MMSAYDYIFNLKSTFPSNPCKTPSLFSREGNRGREVKRFARDQRQFRMELQFLSSLHRPLNEAMLEKTPKQLDLIPRDVP